LTLFVQNEDAVEAEPVQISLTDLRNATATGSDLNSLRPLLAAELKNTVEEAMISIVTSRILDALTKPGLGIEERYKILRRLIPTFDEKPIFHRLQIAMELQRLGIDMGVCKHLSLRGHNQRFCGLTGCESDCMAPKICVLRDREKIEKVSSAPAEEFFFNFCRVSSVVADH